MIKLPEIRFTERVCNGVKLHVAEAGPETGPLVILLHGFPEFWYGWRHQIAALTHAGYHVVVPDQRGYNLSDKPVGIANYDVDKLSADVIALGAHYTNLPFRLVGHDWGAVAAWWTATRHPEKLRTLCVLNCPHPAVWRDAMANDPEQRRASFYVRVFALPWLPELLMRGRNFRALVTAIRGSRKHVSDADVEEYRKAWAQPGALTAMINWYRAILRRKFSPVAHRSIMVPVHIIWGAEDIYARPALAEASKALCHRATLTFLPKATHWVAHDEPEHVNAILLDALRA
jgi:pimeloyl-ACP methyl ester carboxylesterase